MLIPTTLIGTSQAGVELDYAQITTDVTVSATASPGDAVVSLPARIYDGVTVIMVEFCAFLDPGASVNAELVCELFDSTTLITRIADVYSQAAQVARHTVSFGVRLTPTAASHTYNVKAFRAVANGTVRCTPGFPPTWLRTVRV